MVHLAVGRMAERTNRHATKGVQIEPREDLRMLARELDHRARFGFAGRKGAGAGLLVGGRPTPREVTIEIDGIVGHEIRRRNVPTIEVLDVSLGKNLVERTDVAVINGALDEHAGDVARFDHFAGGILFAHQEAGAVSVDVAEDPARRGTCDAFIAGHRADEARARDDRFGAVRRHAWKYVNQHFAQHRVQLRGDGRRRRLEVNPQHFFGDGERYARAGEFRRVHVAIDPRGGPDARRFTTNGKQPQFATFGRGADGCELADLGIGGRPRAQLRGDGVV